MKVNMFFDMDGVVAKWNTEATIEDTFAEGYFDTVVEPDFSAISAIKQFIEKTADNPDIYVAFLSARYDDETAATTGFNRFERDKLTFLSRYGLDCVPVHFVSCGQSKTNVFYDVEKADVNILFDDYTKNCLDWRNEPNCYSVKWLNGINNTHGTFQGLMIPAFRMTAPIVSGAIALTTKLTIESSQALSYEA